MSHRSKLKWGAAQALLLCLAIASPVLAENTGQYIDDAAITTKVKAALLSDSQLKSTKISVETNGGVVQLTGSVNTPDEEAEAVTAASHVNGVQSVKNKLSVTGAPQNNQNNQ